MQFITNKDRILIKNIEDEDKIKKLNNYFFVSSDDNFFDFNDDLEKIINSNVDIGNSDFIKKSINSFYNSNRLNKDNLYFFEFKNDYLDYVKFKIMDEKFLIYKKKKSGNIIFI